MIQVEPLRPFFRGNKGEHLLCMQEGGALIRYARGGGELIHYVTSHIIRCSATKQWCATNTYIEY